MYAQSSRLIHHKARFDRIDNVAVYTLAHPRFPHIKDIRERTFFGLHPTFFGLFCLLLLHPRLLTANSAQTDYVCVVDFLSP